MRAGKKYFCLMAVGAVLLFTESVFSEIITLSDASIIKFRGRTVYNTNLVFSQEIRPTAGTVPLSPTQANTVFGSIPVNEGDIVKVTMPFRMNGPGNCKIICTGPTSATPLASPIFRSEWEKVFLPLAPEAIFRADDTGPLNFELLFWQTTKPGALPGYLYERLVIGMLRGYAQIVDHWE